MSAHFLLTPAARGFDLMEIATMNETELRMFFQRVRWPTSNGAPICPRCNMPSTGPDGRGRYHCKSCLYRFTLTSNTALHGNKLPLRTILLVICLLSNSAKGRSAVEISRSLRIHYRTAFLLCHKIRYAIAVEAEGRRIGGVGRTVATDGVYLGFYVRKANWRENRRDLRLARNKNPKGRVVVAAREHGGRTIVTVVHREADALGFLVARIKQDTVLHADEAPGWNELHQYFDVKRINHSESYSDGMACTNAAESLFARFRLLEKGQHHHIAGPYLYRYASEVAFREDFRRISSGEMAMRLLSLALTSGPDKILKGYVQRRRRGLRTR